MKNLNRILLLVMSIWIGNQGFSQAFDKLVFRDGIDRNHYSIETIPDEGYVVAGTEFGDGLTDIHVFKTDLAGNIIWEMMIDESDDDRALDAVVTDGKVVITGYVSTGASSQLYVAALDLTTGILISDFKLKVDEESPLISVGTNIVHNEEEDFYIVGGFQAEKMIVTLDKNRGILIKLDGSLNLLGTPSYVLGDIPEHTSINDIVQIPDGYFVTGSIGLTPCSGCPFQGVLAMTITNDLDLTQNLSFESTNSHHIGVSAVYNEELDHIYLMSNNSILHNPQINIITGISTGTGVHSTRYYLPLDATGGVHNPAGFHLENCPWDDSKLIAMGYFRTDGPGEAANNDATPWICEFSKDGGSMVDVLTWDVPSENFYLHGGDVLSTFTGQQPYVFNQEIFTIQSNSDGIVFISPNTNNDPQNFNIELVTTRLTDETNCFNKTTVEPMLVPVQTALSIQSEPVELIHDYPAYVTQNTYSDVHDQCDVSDQNPKRANGNTTSGSNANSAFDQSVKFNVSPNPSTGMFTVELYGENLGGQIEVLNAIGQVIYTSEPIQGEYFRVAIDGKGFEEGIYFLKYKNGQDHMVKKIIKI